MRRLLILLLLALPTHIFTTNDIKSYSNNELLWPPLKYTKLHFYVHGKLAPPNETTVEVTRPENNDLPFNFGQLHVFDEPLTRGPNIVPPIWGRCQGMFIMSDLNTYAWVVSMSLVFSDRLYVGSTLSLLGRYHLHTTEGVLPIVGGTRALSYAQGFCKFKIARDPLNSVIPVECDVYYRSPLIINDI